MQNQPVPVKARTDGGAIRTARRTRQIKVAGWLLLLALFQAPLLQAGPDRLDTYTATLAWEANPSNNGIVGYSIYYGGESGNYTNEIQVGNASVYTVTGLEGGVPYYFAVTAWNEDGIQSDFSQEVEYLPGGPKVRTVVTPAGQAVVTVQGLGNHWYDILASENLIDWAILDTVATGPGGAVDFVDALAANYRMRFYRVQETLP